MDESISSRDLQAAMHSGAAPLIIDVRRQPVFRAAEETIAGALWRDPALVSSWAQELPSASKVVAYCAHGHDVSQGVAKTLNDCGIATRYLQGGIDEGWKAAGGELARKPAGAHTRWVTRERPKIDRIACPWLIARFIDKDAEFLYVPTNRVLEVAKDRDGTPYDIPDVAFSHVGELCSFDAFLKRFNLNDPAMQRLALIVRGADTAKLDLAPQAPGLAAISLGLSRNFSDDHQMLEHGMVVYDALYTWCKEGQDEVHTWNPAAYRKDAEPARS
jgi:rhodanese-related sulfurtransferase